MKNFQLILLFIFGGIAVIAVLIFSGVFGGNNGGANDGSGGTVVMWGSFSEGDMRGVFDSFEQKETSYTIEYVEKTPSALQRDLIEAIARGAGPDIILIPEFMLSKNEDLIQPLESETLTERQFLDYFTNGSRVFLGGGHIFAFPFAVDPVVLYWNRSMFQAAGLPLVPTTWNDVLNLPRKLTTKDQSGNITQSAIALGGVDNIEHLKEILSAFILETGDQVVTRNENGRPEVVLGGDDGPSSIFEFYNNFSNPRLSTYSWNPSLPLSRTAFTGEKLALYLGLASDYGAMPEENPHLDFDVAVLPQLGSGGVRTTFAHIYGFALLKSAPHIQAAYAVMQKLAFGDTPQFVEENLKIPSARNDVLAKTTTDPVQAVFAKSAIIARSWLDPNYAATQAIFEGAISGVTTGRLNPGEAISRIAGLIKEEFDKIRL